MSFVLQYIDNGWNWDWLSCNSKITVQDIEQNLSLPWSWEHLSHSPNISLSFVLRHKERNWHWIELSMNPAMRIREIKAHPELPWRSQHVSANPNMCFEYALYRPSEVNVYFLSQNALKYDENLILIHTRKMQQMYYKNKKERIRRVLRKQGYIRDICPILLSYL
jgi:hypothetical protein